MSAHADRYEGWKAIAVALGCSVHTAQRWARRNEDPLPVRENHNGMYSIKAALAAWCDRQDKPLQVADELRSLRAEVATLRDTVGRSEMRVVRRTAKQA